MLENERKSIDEIDRQLVALFEKRMHVTKKIAQVKSENQLPIYDAVREAAVIDKVIQYLTDDSLSEELSQFYVSLMNISKNYQEKTSK
ncbi:chorismate mutase [Jeotgalibaca ciconiae]|uniref:Chorismate mutase n=1 Tax=Jeotgalibaca ciconiae TaxID=2496265 RepID=A0A3S9H7F0_9LACT|nr:chorismate mutase [Jeotgalibaca ciconiae]AZP03282.1 chorismate mutase [Jeotgalibaca ciconiae]HJB23605.1 chorismate mutase [Candidatus Jeotgalibaca pullicola]